jgi:hypothetical protein
MGLAVIHWDAIGLAISGALKEARSPVPQLAAHK